MVSTKIKNILTSIVLPPTVLKEQGINFFHQRLLHYLVLSLATLAFLAYRPIIYFLGLGLLIAIVPAGAGPLWLLMFSIMTSVLLGIGPALISLGINAATWIILSLFVYLEKFPWMESLPDAATLWIVIGVNLLCINAVVALSVAVIINQINKMFQKEKTVGLKLKQEIQTRIKTEKKNEDLATKLYNSQRMEAILVVDDVKEQRSIASDMLKKLGYLVTLAASGEQAVDYMRKNSLRTHLTSQD